MSKKLVSLLLAVCMVVSFIPSTVLAVSGSSLPFTDVESNAWYYESVEYVYTKGLMNGIDTNLFAPKKDLTRAMFVTILGRLDGVDTSNYKSSSYSDVSTGLWYSPYVEWASDKNIVTGYEDGTFKPIQAITREQMATIIARYIDIKGITLYNSSSAVSSFKDISSVRAYVLEGLELMRSSGIITGDENGNFNPSKTASRAEVTAIIMRLDSSIDTTNTSRDTTSTIGVSGDNTNTKSSSSSSSGQGSSGGSGSGSNNSQPNTGGNNEYTVTFDLNYPEATNLPKNQKVISGGQATEPSTPTRDKYIFYGWYSDKNGNNDEYNFLTQVYQDTALYAFWIQEDLSTIDNVSYKPHINNNVIQDNDENIIYLNNQLLLTANEEVTPEQVSNMLSRYGVKIIGMFRTIDDYQIELDKTYSLNELNAIIGEISLEDIVESITLHELFRLSLNSLPSDGALYTDGNEIDINNTWPLYAINLPEAWDYMSYMRSVVKIGVIDSYFDTNHKDLSNIIRTYWNPDNIASLYRTILNDNPSEISTLQALYHGTAVTGIIGATHNDIGLAGTVPHTNLMLYLYSHKGSSKSYDGNEATPIGVLKDALVSLIELDKVQVINMSIGVELSSGGDIGDSEKIGKALEKVLKKYRNKEYNFLIVQSAGNDNTDVLSQAQLATITDEDLKDRIIIVGASTKDNKIATYSNYGQRVDVVAPGNDIYCLFPDNSYSYDTGTSMSTPYVAGIAGLIWSINPKLSASEVKKNIVDTAQIAITDNVKGTYSLVNAEKAVIETLNRIGIEIEETTQIVCKVTMNDIISANAGYFVSDANIFTINLLDENLQVIESKGGNINNSTVFDGLKLNDKYYIEIICYGCESYLQEVTIVEKETIVDISLVRLHLIGPDIVDAVSGESIINLSGFHSAIYDKDNNLIGTSEPNGNSNYYIIFQEYGLHEIHYIVEGYKDYILKIDIDEFTVLSTIEMEPDVSSFAGGDGTENNPYQISTPEQLDAVRNDLSANYIVVNDIDLSVFNNWEPIGDESNYFTGTFDGNNYTIKNMTINIESEESKIVYAGLFGYVENATIKNSNISKSSITVTSDKSAIVGAVIGYAFFSTIQNCNVDKGVNIYATATLYDSIVVVGGFSGSISYSTVENCSNSGTVNGKSDNIFIAVRVAGISADVSGSTIFNCENNGYVTGIAGGSIYGGGIIAVTRYSTQIEDCINSGIVEVTCSSSSYSYSTVYASGILGFTSANENYSTSIINCTNRADIYALAQRFGSYIGGITGYSASVLYIENCNNSGTLISKRYYTGLGEVDGHYAGGILGANFSISSFDNCTSSGVIFMSTSTDSKFALYEGGLLGYVKGTSSFTSNCYYLSDYHVIGYQTSSANIIGLEYALPLDDGLNIYSIETSFIETDELFEDYPFSDYISDDEYQIQVAEES